MDSVKIKIQSKIVRKWVRTRDVKSPHDFHLTSGKRWGDPRWLKITSPHPWKIEVVWKSPHLTSKKIEVIWNHLTSPQKNRGDFQITSPHLKKIKVILKSPHLRGEVIEVINIPGLDLIKMVYFLIRSKNASFAQIPVRINENDKMLNFNKMKPNDQQKQNIQYFL